MLIYTKITDLQAFLNEKRALGNSIGFVPTMGALHEGHLSLIEISKNSCKIAVCSIFVNPTQFNDKNDFARYPRTPEKDAAMLQKAGCDALFMPEVAEIYPNDEATEQFDFGYLDKILEGEHRKGHFNGVGQVVKRLFEIVEPNKAFFGSKDYQQVMIVKALVKLMNSAIEIVPCPILREADGLAMSSRNMLLSAEERLVAGKIPLWMQQAKTILNANGIKAAKDYIHSQVKTQALMKLDYFEVCHKDTLEIITNETQVDEGVSLIAVFVGKIRLIDNLS